MVTINTLTRELMLKANNYQAQHKNPPSVRNLWVTPLFYEYLCKQFNQRGDSYKGYTIKIKESLHANYYIELQ